MLPFYKLLPELPPPPQYLIDQVIIDSNNLPTTTNLHKINIRQCIRNGSEFLASKAVRVPASVEFETWFQENILQNYVDVSVNYRYFNSDTGGVHTDTTREFALSYNITQGGPQCGVTWWQQRGYPLYRALAIQHLNFDDIDPVCSVQGPMGSWFLVDTRILHSVENISGQPRVQFSVSLNSDHIPPKWLTIT